MDGGVPNVELAWRDLERETSKRYKGFVVRFRLKRFLNEAVKSNANVLEEMRRFPGRHIVSVKSPNVCVLPSNCAMFVPILMDMFNHWFAQGAIPGSVTKGVITLLKNGGRHVREGLDNYRPITLLNTVKDFGPGLSDPLTGCH